MPAKSKSGVKVPSQHDWRTTDEDEINRRRQRAESEEFSVSNLDARHSIFSNFKIKSGSGLTYSVEIRDVRERQFLCTCVDYRINGLGTCKHVEAVLLHLERRFRRRFAAAAKNGTARIDIVPDDALDTLRVANGGTDIPRELRKWFDRKGVLRGESPEACLEALDSLKSNGIPELRVSQEVELWLTERRNGIERKRTRREYEQKVRIGEWPVQETKVPLYPYQREGMLHLAFVERGLLADEMGLGKTIQAIAACALLHRLGKAKRVLVVTPASLKTEWEDQIQQFTELPYQLVFGHRLKRLPAYDSAPFFTIVNYEQMLADGLDVNARLHPDIVVLDEAQRIKNWSTKTSQAIKRLVSRYAFVLTGTPIENRIDEMHSLMDFLNPSVLGPLFRFNREFYVLDDRGRPEGYQNLERLHARIQPYMLRRRKDQVETELPDRTDRTHFVPLSEMQKATYEDHCAVVSRLVHAAKRRPLTKQEQEKLMRHMAMMRMVCDTNYILDPDDRVCPKLVELEKILEECRENDAKVIIFSEWERMLQLVRELCDRLKMGYAWHTGSVPQKRRRAEINAFKSDPNCQVFLSTDSGSTGLNLQAASVVINCDLPWNPAKLEQRIARAWRKHQTKPVTVIHLVSEKTIEHRMLETLANKQALADGVLDSRGDFKEIKLRRGGQAFLAKLEQLVAPQGYGVKKEPVASRRVLPADRALGFGKEVKTKLGDSLVRCEERFPNDAVHSVLMVVVDRDAEAWRDKLTDLHQEYFGPNNSDPLSPVHLEVIDRSTQDALERLIAAGLVARTTRASRPLVSEGNDEPEVTPLSGEEKAKADQLRQQAARKLKMARLLGEGDMMDEARASLLDTIQQLGCALAVENRLPEPIDLKESLLPPSSHLWKDGLETVRNFVNDSAAPWEPVAEQLSTV